MASLDQRQDNELPTHYLFDYLIDDEFSTEIVSRAWMSPNDLVDVVRKFDQKTNKFVPTST